MKRCVKTHLKLCSTKLSYLWTFQYLFQIVVDGLTVLEVENSQPAEFEQVQVFASDPWYPPLNGKIKNFQYSTTTTKQSFSIISANLTVDDDIDIF